MLSKSGKKKVPKIETIDVYTKTQTGERRVHKFLYEPKQNTSFTEEPTKH